VKAKTEGIERLVATTESISNKQYDDLLLAESMLKLFTGHIKQRGIIYGYRYGTQTPLPSTLNDFTKKAFIATLKTKYHLHTKE